MAEQTFRDTPKLQVGDVGYYREFGETWPARVLANDVVQTFGPIDAIIAVAKYPGHEFIVRLVRRSNSCTNGRWVSREQFAQEERAAIAREGAALIKRAEAIHG